MDADQQKIFDEATEHPYECKCEKCQLWWEEMPPEDDEEDPGVRLTLRNETIINGIRFEAGNYLMIRIGPPKDEPEF